jgi:hypothetical protein
MIEAGFPQKRVLAKEHVDFDAVAEQEHSATLATAERLRETGRPKDDRRQPERYRELRLPPAKFPAVLTDC